MGRSSILACVMLVAALIPSTTIHAEAGLLAPGSIAFEPSTFHAGEKVRAQLNLGDPPVGLTAFGIDQNRESASLGATPDLEILGAALAKTRGNWVYTVTFRSWAPGEGTFPSLSIGGHRFPSFTYDTRATSGIDDPSPGPRRPQVDPPGTGLYLYAAVALVAILALLALAGIFWILPGARALLEVRRMREAFRALSQTLDWLEANAEGSARDWYGLLARSLRLYLSRRLIPEAEALTSSELRALQEEGLPQNGFKEGLAFLLGQSDQACYAGIVPAPAERRVATRQARELATLVEEWEGRAHARA